MKKIKSIIVMILAAVLITSVISLPVSAASYDSTAAVSYASKHWNDGVGACATFVSNCLKAGGCTAWASIVKNLRSALKDGGWGTEYVLTRTGAYTYKSSNEGKLSAGDPIFFYCKTCQMWQHVVLCSGFDSSGKAKAYAHNAAWNDKTFATFIDEKGHTGEAIVYYSIHMNSISSNNNVTIQNTGVENITSSNAFVKGVVNKPKSAVVEKVGIKIRKEENTYTEEWKFHQPPASSAHTNTENVTLTWDLTAECGYVLRHATKYYYRLYAKINGVDYFSEEASFTTKGSHSYGSWSTTKSATCTATGTQTRKCSCGKTETKTINALGHSYSAETCTKAKTCKVCGVTSGSARGHKYDNACDKTCNTCGATRSITHTYSNSCDTSCNVCNTIRTITHTYSSKSDASCNVCGAIRGIAKIVTQPKTAYASKGKTVSTTVKATGDGLTYTWYVSDVGDTKYYKSSITSATYSIKMTEAKSNRKAYCVITDKYGNKVTTNTVRLRMKATIVTQPKTAYASKGAKASVTVKAAGDGLKYTWYVSDVGDTKYYKSSITSATYSVKMTEAKSNRKAYCVITDKYGKKVTTNTVRLRMKATITTQPKSVTVAKNKTAKTTIKAAGDGLTYTWYIKDKGDSKYTKSSIKSATYSCKMIAAKNGRRIICIVKDKYGKTVQSKTIVFKVK